MMSSAIRLCEPACLRNGSPCMRTYFSARRGNVEVLVSAIWLCPALVPRDFVLLDMRLFAWATTDFDSARNELLSSVLSLLKAPEVHQQTGNPTPEHILVTETMEEALFAGKGRLHRPICAMGQAVARDNSAESDRSLSERFVYSVPLYAQLPSHNVAWRFFAGS